MSFDLEKYLKKHREALDVDSPDDPVIWEGIRKDLQLEEGRSEKSIMWIKIRNMAALVILLLSVGYVMGDLLGERRADSQISLANVDRDLGIKETAYQTFLSHKMREAGPMNEVDNLIILELLEEIQRLDTIYEQTMKDLGELGYNEQVIHTIFDTYEKKIYLLELIILENNKSRNYETDENIFL